MAGELKSTSEAGTLILILSNPAFKNALGPEMYAAGIEALNAAENNPEIRSVVITGEGSAFCAGGNLLRLQASRNEAPDVQTQSIDGLHNFIDSIRTYPKPVIAAVEGAAAGAGFSLALACDLCIAADDAIFVMAHSTVGLSPDGGGSWALARTLPRALVNEMLLCGERISAHRLQSFGFVNQLCSPGRALAASLELAARLNARAANVTASIKELVNEAPSRTLSEHLGSERTHFVANLRHPNAGEGIDAFLTKRTPHYR